MPLCKVIGGHWRGCFRAKVVDCASASLACLEVFPTFVQLPFATNHNFAFPNRHRHFLSSYHQINTTSVLYSLTPSLDSPPHNVSPSLSFASFLVSPSTFLLCLSRAANDEAHREVELFYFQPSPRPRAVLKAAPYFPQRDSTDPPFFIDELNAHKTPSSFDTISRKLRLPVLSPPPPPRVSCIGRSGI